MAQDVELMQDKPCCAALKKKHTKLLEKYSKLEELKNKFRDCTALVQEKYDVIEKENESLKKALEEVKVQANVWKDEKENEAGRRIDLEDEVSALQDEVKLLKQNGNSASQDADKQLQERLVVAEKEIKQLKELLNRERGRAASEKKNAMLEKKKADEALKKLSALQDEVRLLKQNGNSASKEADGQLQEHLVEAEREIKQLKELLDQERGRAALEKNNAELEKKKANEALKKVFSLQDELRLLKQNGKSASQEADEQLKERLLVAEREIKQLKELLDQERGRAALEKKNAGLEKKKADEALKKVEIGKNKVGEAQKVANAERKKAEENRLLLEKLKKETDDMKSMFALEKSKSEAAEKKVESEKQKAIRERKRADLAVAKSEEQRKLAETNLKKAKFEKDRADDLNRKLEEARNRAEKLQETRKHKCSSELIGAQGDESNAGRNAELANDIRIGMLKNDAQSSQWMEKILLEKEHNIIRETKRADSEKKKAKKQKKVAEEHKKMAMEQKYRADQLSKELESYKLRFKELQKELQELVSCRIYAGNAPLRNNNVTSESDTVELLKKQLELERLLVKHAKKETELEAFRNKMLYQELCHLRQECLQFQQHLDILDKSFFVGLEGANQLKKIGNQTFKSEMLCSDGYHRQLISGIDSRMDPPDGGSNQKMLQSSAINSSSASFSDRPLVGSQERGTSSVMTSASLGEDISNLEPKMARLSEKMSTRHNKHDAAKADKSVRSPIKDSANKMRIGYCEKKRILDAAESIDNLSEGQKLHQRASKKLSLLHGILDNQKDELEEENLKETPRKELSRPWKKKKTSSEATVVIHPSQKSGEPKTILASDIDRSDACMPAPSPGSDVMKFDSCCKDRVNNISGCSHCTQDFDEMVIYDYMKLLDLDNTSDENSYRRAIAMPLSPMLPEVEFYGDEKLEVDNSQMLVCKSFQEGLSNVRDNPASLSIFHDIGSEKNDTNLLSNSLALPWLQMEKDSVDLSKTMDSLSTSDTHFQVPGGKLGMSDLSGSGNEETSISCENGIGSYHGRLLKYFVVSSDNKENSSIVRILQSISSCMPHSSFTHSVETFLQSILRTLLKAGDLSIKEKACVFFSLLLHEISEVALKNLTNVLSDTSVHAVGSVTIHINSAFSDPVFRKMFMESCDLFEVLAVIEDFLLQRKVLFCGDASAESEILLSSKLDLVLNGNVIMLSEVVASARLLVVGASLLASLCSAVDHIGFVCEISSNIIRMQKSDPAVMLAVLHSFACMCGSKYFSLQQYSLAMTAVKSIVMLLEKQTLSTDSTSLLPSRIENPSKFWSCSNCPFSEGAVSLKDVALLLLQNLQKHCHSGSQGQEFSGLREAIPLSSRSDENLFNFIDILSLIEVLASFMSWDWTSDHLIWQICEYLESHLMEGSSAAILILLGQLGRLGVGASGYEDSRVEKLRGWLSALLCESTFMKLSISVQFAIVTSLFGLTPLKFEDIIEGKVETQAVMSQSIPASFIREWFSSLSHEQQSFLRLHQATNESNC